MHEPVALVTGATGAVGPSVVRAYQAAGYSVRTLSLRLPEADVLPPCVDMRTGDVCDLQTVQSAVAGVDVIVHLAAVLHQSMNLASLGPQYQRVNVGGTENIVRAAVTHGVPRLVFLSTIAVYGPSFGLLIDESTRPRPDTIYGQTKLAAERAVLSATSGGRPIGTVLRAASVYGPRVKGNYRRLAEAIARHRFIPIGSCLNRRTLVHDLDLANAAVLAGAHPGAAGAVFNVSDGHVHTLADIIEAIYQAVDRPPARVNVPLGIACAAAAVCETACRLIRVTPPLSRGTLEKYTEDIAVDGTLIQRALGFAPSVDLERGWQRTMTALSEAGG